MTSPYRAPRGNHKTAKGWIQEAAKRMLLNNLDSEVAEKPEELIVYGGRGKAARSPQDLQRILGVLERLEKRIWVGVYGVAAFLLTQGAEALIRTAMR